MSRSGQAFVAATEGHQFTMYAMMRAMGIPLSAEQEKSQAYLERTYPAVVNKGHDLACLNCNWQGVVQDTGKVYVPDPQCPDEVIPELCCPICSSVDFEF